MLVKTLLMSATFTSQPAYPPEFERFADRIYDYVEAHPEGQDIIEYASCALWFYRTEQYEAHGHIVPRFPHLWDIEIPYELERWSDRVDPDRGVAWADDYLATRHERLSDRLCYAMLVGLRVEVLEARAAEREAQP